MKPNEKTVEFEPEGEGEKDFGFQITYYPQSIVLPVSIEFGLWWIELRIINYSILLGWIEWDEEDE